MHMFNISCTCGNLICMFSVFFPCPTSSFGKTKLWVVNLNSRKCRCGVLVVFSVHAHVQHLMHLRQSDLHVFRFDFSMSHFKVRENEIVGGGIGCEIQSLQFYPSHFLPQDSGKSNCRGWGVIFVQNYNISCTCGKSNYIFFLCRFPFPTSQLEKM